MPKYKVTLSKVIGPLRTMEEVVAAKKYLSSAVQGVKFGKITKTARGYRFTSSLTHVKMFEAPITVIKSAIQKQAPSSKVSVTKA